MVLRSDGGAVCGEIYEVDEATLRSLDELEDYYGPNDPRNEYERVKVVAKTNQGDVSVWIYVYAKEPAESDRIVTGDWRGHRRRRES